MFNFPMLITSEEVYRYDYLLVHNVFKELQMTMLEEKGYRDQYMYMYV